MQCPMTPEEIGSSKTSARPTAPEAAVNATHPYHVLLEAAPDIVLVIGRDGQILEANRAAILAYGYPSDELRQRTIQDLRAPATHGDLPGQLAEATETGLRFETLHCRQDGSTFPVEVNARAVQIDGETVLCSIIRDIAARKSAEAVLAQRTAQLDALRELTAEITRELDLESLLRLIIEKAIGLLQAGAGAIWRWEAATQRLTIETWVGHGEYMRGRHLGAGEGVAGQVVLRRQSLIINDYPAYPYAHPATLAHAAVTALLATPLCYRGELLGVLIVDNRNQPARTFVESDRDLLELFAPQAAIAVANAQLYAATRQELQERQAAEAALQASETRYRSLFTHMQEGLAYCRMLFVDGRPDDFVYLEVNGAFTRLTGLTDVVGKPVSAVLPGIRVSDPEILRLYGRVVTTGIPEKCERYVTALHMWFAISVYRPHPGHFVAIFDVVTARKQAAAALQDSQARLEALFAAIPDAMFEYDASGQPVRANAAALKVLGRSVLDFTREQIVATLRFTQLDGCPVPLDALPSSRALRGETVAGEPYAIQAAVDQARILAVYAAPLWQDGTIRGAVGLWHDITALQRAAAALQASEARYRRLFEEAIEGICLADAATGEIVDCNAAFLRLTGYARGELLGQPQRMLHPPEVGGPPVTASFAQHRGEAQGQILRVPLVPKAGPVKQVEVKANAIALGGRQLLQGFFRDVTEELQLQEERETALTLLRLLNDQNHTHELIREVTRLLQTWTGCEAVGVRLRVGEDFPYFETRGFAAEFVQAENRLCLHDAAREPLRDHEGNAILACLCGNVLSGRTDPTLPCFTTHGSFWTNNTTQLRATMTEAEHQACLRHRCDGAGYESVALIPLRAGATTLGLLQFNDRAPGRFTPALLAFLERAADQLAIGLGQRQAHAALQTSEARFRALVETAFDWIWEVAADGTYTYASPRVQELLGYAPEEVIGQTPFAFMPEDAARRAGALFAAWTAERQPFLALETVHRHRDGRLIILETSGVPMVGPDGQVTGYRGTARDITARRQADAAMQERLQLEERLSRLAAAAPGVMYVFRMRPDGSICFPYAGPAADRIFGLRPTAMVEDAAAIFQRIHPDDLAAVQASIQESARQLSPWQSEFRVQHPEQGVIWVEARSTPEREADGGTLWHGFAHDISGRKRAEQALRDSEARARQLAQENALMAEIGRIVGATLDLEEIYEEFSARVKQVLPFDRIVISVIDMSTSTFKHVHMSTEPLQGRQVGMVFPLAGSGIAEVVRTRTSFLLQTEEFGPYAARFPMLLPTFQAGFRSLLHVPLFVKGELIGALLLCARMPNAYTPEEVRLAERIGAQIAGTIANVQLYAARRAAEQERAALEEQFRQAQKMEAVGRLAGGVAHDFNNLLTVVTGCVYVLLTGLPADDPARQFLGDIQDAAERAGVLTRQLLAFSRKQILQPKVLDLNDIVGNLEKMLRRLIGEDVALSTVLAPGLDRVRVDPGQLEQVILNLVVNARDAMPLGGRLTLETRAVVLSEAECRHRPDSRPGQYLQLSVSDTGCGMPPEVQARIFEPFYTTKAAGKGTGLGLATVFGIVKQSDGHIEVDSTVGMGTTFRIYLPAVLETDPAPRPEDRASRAELGRETILLVEDEEAVRRIVKLTLETQGYTVLEARDAHEAVGLADTATRPIDLLITDVVMPGMNGRILADQLRTRAADLRVLFISGYTDDALVQYGVRESTAGFLQKPFSPRGLARKVREVLDRP
jgi:PAS domain S-box-containing protein